MKVQDIRSFFKQPKAGNSSTVTSPVVEVPSRRRRSETAKEKKTKGDSQTEDELESVDTKQKGKSKESNRDGKTDKRKRKSRVLSDSDDDFDTSKSLNQSKEKNNSPSREKTSKNPSKANKTQSNVKDEANSSKAGSSKQAEALSKEEKRDTATSAKGKLSKHSIQTDSAAFSSKNVRAPKLEPCDPTSYFMEKPKNSSKVDSKQNNDEKSGKPHSSLEKKSEFKVPTPTPTEKKVSKRPSNTVDDGSDSDDGFNPRGKAPPTKKSKVSVAEEKTPVKNVEKAEKEKSNKRNDKVEKEEKTPIKKAEKTEKEKSNKKIDKIEKEEKTPLKRVEKAEKEEKTPEQKQEQRSNYLKFISRNQTPRNLGSKDLPIGAENCLQGLTFVMTGVLDSLERDDAKEFITKYGGRVTGSISGKTSFVIVGEEAGDSKLKKAATLKVPQISEDDLLEMVRKSNPNGQAAEPMDEDDKASEEHETRSSRSGKEANQKDKSPRKATDSRSKAKTPSPTKPAKSDTRSKEKTSSPTKPVKADVKSKDKTPSPTKSVKAESKTRSPTKTLPASSSSVKPREPAVPIQPSTPSLMWVDKYKPKVLKDVVGQAGDASNAKKLLRWLKNWFQYHGSSTDKAKASWPGLKDPEGKTFKCALLSGSPGIGKTTTAHLACREVGYDYFEMNASDTRNKRGLHEHVSDALSSNCITFGSKKEELTRKHVLIMDEVDGMSGNEDRGGVQELIGLIKSSRVPIICICNDRNHPKIRSLANYCFDLRFNKPSFVQLKSFMMSLCFKEKIKIAPEKLQQLIISTDQDVRQIIHQLELFKDAKGDAAYNPRKDLSFGPWDVVRKVFSAPDRVGKSIHDKTGLFFQDYSIGPLFVQENYLRYVPQAAKGDVFKHMDILKATAESIADGDLVDNILRRTNNWSLLPVQAIFSSYAPGEYMDGHCSSAPAFPMWLGKNSNKNKRARLLQQLHSHMHLNVSGSLEALNMEYLPFLRRSIVNPLASGDVEESVQKMEDYTLIREDLDNINELSLWPGMRDNMDKVDSKVKAAFTRKVNKEILPYSVVKVPKAKAKTTKDEDLEGLEEDDEAEVSEEEETLDKDAMVKVKTKTTAKKPSKSSKASSSKRGYDEESDDEDPKPSKKSKEKAGSSKAGSSKRARK